MEDSLELEEWLEDIDQNLKKKLDDDQHASRGDLETLKASIGRHQPDEIDRQPPHIIDLHPPDRPPIWTEEAAGFHKRVKRIHDPVKIVVPCAVFETESPIPPDRTCRSFSERLRFQDEVDKSPTEPVSIDTDRIPSIDTNKPASIDTTTSPSIDTTASPSIDTTTSSSIDSGRVSEQKEFDVCGNLRDGETTTRLDKSGGKKRRNWKKRKRIMSDSQEIQSPQHILFIAEMIDKGEESPKVKLNDYNRALSGRQPTIRSKKKEEPSKRLPSVSTDANLSTSIDIALPASTDINILTSVDIHSGLVESEQDLVATTIKACFIRIPTKRIRTGLGGGNHQASCSRSYARFTEEWSVCLASGSCRGDDGLSIDNTALVSIDSDAKIWAERNLCPTEAQKPHKVTKIPLDDQKPYLRISKPLLTAKLSLILVLS
uniref:Uncharacterized protein n=1 Tax=Brassica oleracea var. oleracea TaxID=109376 RepID=A0A0D3CFD2_BRAOL